MRNFLILTQGQFFSALGTGVFTLALVLYFKELKLSATTISLIFIFSQLPNTLLSPFIGSIIDRFSKKWLFVISDLICFAVNLVMYTSYEFFSGTPALLISSILFLSIFSSSLAPAVYSFISENTPINKICNLNTIFEISSRSSIILANVIAVILYKQIGLKAIIFINGATYLFSALSELFIKDISRAKSKVKNNFFKDVKDGLNYLVRNKFLKKYLLMSILLNFVICSVPLLIPYIIELIPTGSQDDIGALFAIQMLGMVLGSIVFKFIYSRFSKPSNIMVLAFIFMLISFSLILFLKMKLVVLTSFLILGVGISICNLTSITTLQKRTPSDFVGRVLTLLIGLSGVLMPISFYFTGVIIDHVKNGTSVLIITNALITVFSILFILLSKDLKSYFSNE